jgi:RNA polymerase sigma-70 factor, ECF subfamily
MTVETDDALLSAYRAGDEAALERLLERHAPAVLRFGAKMCRDDEDAKDVAQETLLAAARGARAFRGGSSLSTWLYTIARSFCIKKRRTSKAAPERIESIDAVGAGEVIEPSVGPDEAAASREIGSALEEAIRALHPMYREVLLLRDVEGLSATEVAEVLELSVDAVKSRLHRARLAVRDRLAPLLEAEPAASAEGCPDVLPMLSRYLEGEIGAAQCAEMDRHVASCPRCRSKCDSLRRTLSLCRSSAHHGAVPAEVQALVRESLRQLDDQQR